MQLLMLLSLSLLAAPADSGGLKAALETIRAVQAEGAGHREAAAAWKQVAAAEAEQLPVILTALDDAGPLAANWIRAAVDAIAERELAGGGQLPAAGLEEFILDTQHSPRGRRLAYDWLARVDPTTPERLLPGMLDDPSVDLRRDAVARVVEQAAAREAAGEKEPAIALYEQALFAARDLDQVQMLTEKLRQAEKTVDLPRHFGFITHWKLIGPFDNTEKRGYAAVYPPETEQPIDLAALHQGKSTPVRWIDHATADEFGTVDLNKALGKNMGAVAYAYAVFNADQARDVELRLGCINANKLWLNGQLLIEREVYHANTGMDQYIARATLKAGPNTILLKVCQNEQTEPWAQNWAFQLRMCDATGTAVLAVDRPETPKADAVPAATN